MKFEITKNGTNSVSYGTPIIASMRFQNGVIQFDLPAEFESVADIIKSELSQIDDVMQVLEIFNHICAEQAHNFYYCYNGIRHKHQFICLPTTKIEKSFILPETKDISDKMYQYGINRKMWSGDKYPYRGSGIVVDERLVSWCIENSHYLADSETEIGIYTEEAYRGKGFATSNVVALCLDLLRHNITRIVYECDFENDASFRVAQKSNLDYNGEIWYLFFTKEK